MIYTDKTRLQGSLHAINDVGIDRDRWLAILCLTMTINTSSCLCSNICTIAVIVKSRHCAYYPCTVLSFQDREDAVYVCFKCNLLPEGASWLILVQATKNQGSSKLGYRQTSGVSWVSSLCTVRAHE